ncbi:MAG: hypothetical protein DMD91_27500 [Candidatus Rokuibacteriota bacterium]|nr:MAG: hypothetical protein DMD91_27500 [Candidatus Rokubacteria bacterium]
MDSLAVRWLFPGKEVQVDARCLDCARPLQLRMRDETFLTISPETMVGHANIPAPRWNENWAFT